MTPRLLAAATAALLALTLGGCSGSSEDDADSPGASTSSTVPADWTTHDGQGFTIAAPEEFTLLEETSGNGEPMLVLEKASEVEGAKQRVAVIRDVNPRGDAESQSTVLAEIQAAEREEVDVPDGQAWLMTWDQELPVEEGETVKVTFQQLMHQVSDELILNVVALAPTEEFDESRVTEVAETFRPA